MVNLGLVILIVLALEHIIFAFVFFWVKSYSIPVAVLRLTGNKERPTLIITKAKKIYAHGIPRLKVRGYKSEFRDYLSENYYPSIRSKWGGLILWEFEDGLLTPVIPRKAERKLSKEQKAHIDVHMKKLSALTGVKFSYDELLHHELKLKAVDDVDTEFLLQDQARIDGQYAGGWKEFLLRYSGHMTIIIISVMMLVGVIVWLDKMPEFAQQCFSQAQAGAKASLFDQASNFTRPPA